MTVSPNGIGLYYKPLAISLGYGQNKSSSVNKAVAKGTVIWKAITSVKIQFGKNIGTRL